MMQKRKLSDMLGSQWSKEELERFYVAYRKHGKDWKKVRILNFLVYECLPVHLARLLSTFMVIFGSNYLILFCIALQLIHWCIV